MGTLENNRFFLNNKKIKKNPLKKNKNIGKFFQDHLGIVVGQLKIESKEKFRKYFENGVFKKNNYQN